MARILPLCYNCHMKVGRINSIINYKKILGVESLLQVKKNPPLVIPEALCKTKKEPALFFGYPQDYFNKPAIDIKRLESDIRGGGTRAIKKVVRESLADPETNGRVTLVAANINDAKPHPFNFYYKLGFRAPEEYYNKMGAEGRPMYKDADIFMYRPKENIEHCLNYRNSVDPKQIGLTYAYGK